jgi:Fe-S oxidoreductase
MARVTGSEVVNPRSRGLMLSYVLRGTIPYSADLDDTVYRCCMCGYCADWCEGNWNPPAYVQEARFDMVERELAPAHITALRDALLKNGMIADPGQQVLSSAENGDANVLLYKGAYPDAQIERYFTQAAALMDRAGIQCAYVAGAPSGFAQLYRLGFREDAQRVARQVLDLAGAKGVRTIATLSTLDAYVLGLLSDEIGCKNDFGIVPVVIILMDAVEDGSIKVNAKDLSVTYHDSDIMARYLAMTDQPRAVLSQLGAALTEMEWHGSRARTTGGLLLAAMYPAESAALVAGRAAEASETGAQALVTGDIEDALLLTGKTGQEVLTLIDVIGRAAL